VTDEPHPASDGSRDALARGNPGAGAWLVWARANPLLAGMVLVFCVGALAALLLSLPAGFLRPGAHGPSRAAARPHAGDESPAAASSSTGGTGSWQPEAAPSDAAGTGPWVDGGAPSPPSARGLSLVYHYRTLPPGGESRYDWIVQVRGEISVLEGVDLVTWHMDPPPKDGGELVSRNRARDGFPLFGDGPGGWFGVSAVVRFKDGNTETISHRVELPEPS
jgi:hypothetical protein